MVDPHTKQILGRWRALDEGCGLRRAALLARILWITGFLLTVFGAYAVVARLNPIFIAVAALAVGWLIAERNALRQRLEQWPIFKTYLDWNRVRQDLNDDA
jgi:hypothetical protein